MSEAYVTIALGAVIIVVVALISVGVMAMIKAVAAKNNGFITHQLSSRRRCRRACSSPRAFSRRPGGPYRGLARRLALQPQRDDGLRALARGEARPARSSRGHFPVTFDDEQDARGLPNAPGTSALNTISSGGLRRHDRDEHSPARFASDAPLPAGR